MSGAIEVPTQMEHVVVRIHTQEVAGSNPAPRIFSRSQIDLLLGEPITLRYALASVAVSRRNRACGNRKTACLITVARDRQI
jgi:hypothetical protein